LETIVVIEEKRPILEDQIRTILYGQSRSPHVVGKHFHGSVFDSARGPVAFPDFGEISPPLVSQVLRKALGDYIPSQEPTELSHGHPGDKLEIAR
jgi:indolepyruvate ferredoxin oxidoreductase